MSGTVVTVGTVGSCDRRGLDLVAVGTGVGASAIFCADVPIRPDTKIGYFWSCDLGSQWGAKNGGFFGERPRGRGENNYFTKGQRPKVKCNFSRAVFCWIIGLLIIDTINLLS